MCTCAGSNRPSHQPLALHLFDAGRTSIGRVRVKHITSSKEELWEITKSDRNRYNLPRCSTTKVTNNTRIRVTMLLLPCQHKPANTTTIEETYLPGTGALVGGGGGGWSCWGKGNNGSDDLRWRTLVEWGVEAKSCEAEAFKVFWPYYPLSGFA